MTRPYWLTIRAELRAPLTVEGAEKSGVPGSAVGFYQNFGITCSSEDEARRLISIEIDPPGDIDWSDSTITPVDVAALKPGILARSGDWTQPGIWYKSGRAFFAAE
jgi:hypothetical protein